MAESGQTDARVAEFITDLRQALAEAGDPARAEQQRAYLKSEMAMYGVGVPDTRRLAQRIAAAHSDVWTEAATWEAALRRLWDGAAHREERYAALAVIRAKLSATHAGRMESLALYEHFLRTGQWWDLVDETSHAVGLVVREHPAAVARMRVWATDPDMWVRRSAILCQLQHKADTDLDLLTNVIEVNQEDPEFFIRKAIGWALRDYARTATGCAPSSRRIRACPHSADARPSSACEAGATSGGACGGPRSALPLLAVGARASVLPQPHAISSHRHGTAHACGPRSRGGPVAGAWG